MKRYLSILLIGICTTACAQSFNEDKNSLINYIKRVYNASPFEGAKKIEGYEKSYYTTAISIAKIPNESIIQLSKKALSKAQILAEQGFAEPCLKFEQIASFENPQKTQITIVYICETLGDFVLNTITKQPFDGARIVSTPNNNYIIATVTLDNSKYTSEQTRDKVAQMKAKQSVNTLTNGSTISSDLIIRTDETQQNIDVSRTEWIKELSMGFINGLQLLTTKELTENKTTYIYYSKI